MTIDLETVANSTKYPLDAFLFVHRGLDFAARQIHGDPPDGPEAKPADDASRHVTGQQLCCGLRDYAIREYGLMARSVLKHWRIHKSEDFGHVVFAMIDAGLMRKTDEDTLQDFTDVYDFAYVFAPRLQLDEAAGAR